MAEPVESEWEVEEFLANWLAEHPLLVPLIAGNVCPLYLADADALPGMTYKRLSTQRPNTMRGPAPVALDRFELVAYGEASRRGYRTVTAIARAVRFAIDGFQGDNRDHHIGRITLDDERDDAEPGMFGDGSLAVVNKRVLQVSLTHTETVKALIQRGATP